ncbi:hypothetical protein [Pelomonas sp. KK5]|uniref:hypothetical protein n=1 Tax=Pelomonas sp. KK5 TaxID=1855730 RepID=UPI00097C474F|nr:hypothetical protein [Pelomonas sp. KK5]
MSKEARQVFGLIEFDRARSVFVGKIIGFPHVEFEGQVLGDVERKLRNEVVAMIASDALVLETEFSALVHLADGAKGLVDLTE